tara:strand:- start:15403 stop:16086 length:684 start_codon:yes stop_codon:yes gene_type:complete
MVLKNKKKLIIFGTGGAAKLAYEKISAKNDIEIEGFLEFKKYYKNNSFLGKKVYKFENISKAFIKKYLLFYLKGYDELNKIREENFNLFKKKNFKFYSYICTKPPKENNVKIGDNCFILENQSLCSNVVIEDNVVIWSNNHIGDRTKISRHSWISSSISIGGDVKIGKNTFIGLNATICNSLRVGKNNFIGSNAHIAKDTKNDEVYIVKPTKKLEINSFRFSKMIKF